MDAIVSYSSEDERDESSCKAAAVPKRGAGRSRSSSSESDGNTDASARTPSPARRSDKRGINDKRVESNAARSCEEKRSNGFHDEDEDQQSNNQKVITNSSEVRSSSHNHRREHSSRHDRNNYGDNRISKNYRNNSNPKDHKEHYRHRGKDSHYSSHNKDRHSNKYSSHNERSDNNYDSNTKGKKDYKEARADRSKEFRNSRYNSNYNMKRDFDRRPNKDHYGSHQKERHYHRDRNNRNEGNLRRSTSKERGTHETDNARLQANGTKDDRKELPTTQNTPRKIEPLMSLPISNKSPKMLTEPSTSNAAADEIPIKLPSYYNPSVINPNKYAEQVQKRKLIWGAKKTDVAAAKWGKATFSEDSDGKVASKFMRLMGIKSGVPANNKDGDADSKPPAAPDVKSREAMFSNMEQQYEVARQVTHTMRGVGLGFSSQARQF